jgi:DNA-directed RNA polymerase specialized sigma24 family protein
VQQEDQDEPGHLFNSEAANDEYFRSSQAAAGARVRQAAVMADISFADQQDLYQEILLDLLERASDYDPTKGSCNTYTGRLSKHCLATFLKNRNTDRKRFEFHSPIEAANDPDFHGSQCGGLYSEVTQTAWSQDSELFSDSDVLLMLQQIQHFATSEQQRLVDLLAFTGSIKEAMVASGLPEATFFRQLRDLRMHLRMFGVKD